MMMPRILIATLALVLAACSSADRSNDTQGLVLLNMVKQQVAARRASAGAAPNTAVLLTRAQLNGINDPLIRTRVERNNTFSLLYIAQRNGASQIWSSPDKVHVTLRAGMMTKTSGLGYDLYSADAPQMLAVLEGRGAVGPARRVHRVMDGSNALTQVVYDCQIENRGSADIVVLERSFRTTHFTESCVGESGSFTNEYWRDGSGAVRASRQQASPEFGHIYMERLID